MSITRNHNYDNSSEESDTVDISFRDHFGHSLRAKEESDLFSSKPRAPTVGLLTLRMKLQPVFRCSPLTWDLIILEKVPMISRKQIA